NGCIEQATIDVIVPNQIVATAVGYTLLCEGDTNGTVTVTASGGRGTAFFQYILTNIDTGIDSGAQTNNVFTGLGAGNYEVTVIDGWGCDVTTLPVEITEPTQVVASLIQLSPLTCDTLAEIEVSATGGTGPYTYSTTPTGPFLPQDTFTVGVGEYQY